MHKLSVLVVDDDPILLMDMAQSLTDVGIVVFEARSADEAWKILSTKSDIRVMISDIEMGQGGLDGFQLAKAVARQWPEIGLLLVSGQNRPNASHLPEGARFLAKPCEPSSLVGNVFGFVAEQRGSI